MTPRAEAKSISAIADFRTALLLYIHKVRPLLDDALDEASRTREWIRVERRIFWENKVRQHARELQDAQQAVFSAQISKLREVSAAEVHAVHSAKRALNAAEEKVQALKRLAVSFERDAQPRMKQAEHLRSVLSTDMQQAAHLLERLVGSLEAYAAVQAPLPGAAPLPTEPVGAEGAADIPPREKGEGT